MKQSIFALSKEIKSCQRRIWVGGVDNKWLKEANKRLEAIRKSEKRAEKRQDRIKV